MRILVIGSGIVGMSTAYCLARDSHSVIVADRAPFVGQGASFANGGQLSYSYVAPLAQPSVLGNLPRWLLSNNSPIRFRPTLEIASLGWILSFLRACSAKRSRATTRILLTLAALSRQTLHEMIFRERLTFAHRQNGKIVFFSTAKSFQSAIRQHAIQAQFGCQQSILDRDACLRIEPTLHAAKGRIVGAVHTPSEEVADCQRLCEELRRVLQEPPYNVEFRLGSPVLELVGDGARVTGARLEKEWVDADVYVVCAGSDSRHLLNRLGIHLPLYPIRGYSISAEIHNEQAAPEHSITDHEHRIVYARIGGVLRVAGFADIVSANAPMDQRRIAALAAATAELFPGASDPDQLHPWAGGRPATPTGIPIIGRTKLSNVLVNVGHGGLGFTLGMGSGRVLADVIGGRRTGIEEDDMALSLAGHTSEVRAAPA
jgi:D-amino-acid dehydrogenase